MSVLNKGRGGARGRVYVVKMYILSVSLADSTQGTVFSGCAKLTIHVYMFFIVDVVLIEVIDLNRLLAMAGM